MRVGAQECYSSRESSPKYNYNNRITMAYYISHGLVCRQCSKKLVGQLTSNNTMCSADDKNQYYSFLRQNMDADHVLKILPWPFQAKPNFKPKPWLLLFQWIFELIFPCIFCNSRECTHLHCALEIDKNSCSHAEDLLNQSDWLNQIDWLNFKISQRDVGKIETS